MSANTGFQVWYEALSCVTREDAAQLLGIDRKTATRYAMGHRAIPLPVARLMTARAAALYGLRLHPLLPSWPASPAEARAFLVKLRGIAGSAIGAGPMFHLMEDLPAAAANMNSYFEGPEKDAETNGSTTFNAGTVGPSNRWLAWIPQSIRRIWNAA